MKRKQEVSTKNVEILADIVWQHMADVRSLRRRHFPRLSWSAVRSYVQRRLNNNQLAAHPLYGNLVCYRATGKTIRILESEGYQVSRSAARELGPDAKRNWYAFLRFCHPEDGPLKSNYRPALDRTQFPILASEMAAGRPDPFRRNIFFQDGDVIGYFVVDRGQPTFIEKKIRPKIFSLLNPRKYPEMRALVDAGRFRLDIAVASESRKDELCSVLDPPQNVEKPQPKPPFPWAVHVFEELQFLTPKLESKPLTLF